MGDAGAFSNARIRVKPPEKGSFPLDHHGICRDMRELWTACMKENDWNSEKCRAESAAYLRCRIDNKLMKPDEIQRLGFNYTEWDTAGQLSSKQWHSSSE
ncbi:unnamed protein product [Mesocestoides corti]|uniref:Cytochrome c oxidase assembly protein COX19 n=1 Tax=Mesocestoides corti TaxID=53468 RepID=A0A0R3UDY7_MESCO|nr:unnamed protein product [Mesocestoides corti]